jgi:membrane associated rhomboid family serine protease
MTDSDARLQLAEGQRLLDDGDPAAAIRALAPLTTHHDAEIAGPALLAIGTARYRTDDEPGALAAWQDAANRTFGGAWMGWRSVAEQHVRDGNLDDAIAAYREADRRAPADERGAIANRIAWLLKETGHDFAARRQFNRARGRYGSYAPLVTWAIIAACVLVFVADWILAGTGNVGIFGNGGPLVERLLIAKDPVLQGEWWRIFTSAFVHLGIAHIAFNMLALNLFGPLLEEMYGHVEYLVIYLLCAAGGSVLTLIAAPDQAAAGASGAIFGLFGLAFIVPRRHHVATTQQARAILGQAGTLLAINLVFTFAIPGISWTGHVGGLLVGLLIGFFLPPRQVATIRTMFRRPDGTSLDDGAAGQPALRAGVYVGVAALLALATYYALALA